MAASLRPVDAVEHGGPLVLLPVDASGPLDNAAITDSALAA